MQASNLNSYIPNPKLVTSDSGSVVATYEVAGHFYAQKFRPDSTTKFQQNGDTISTTNTPFYEDYELLKSKDGCIVSFWASDEGDIYGARICSEQLNVGVNEAMGQNSISVFPNPVDDHFTIENFLADDSPTELYVTDLAGRIVMKVLPNEFHSGEIDVNVSSLPNSSYLLVLKASEIIRTQKFVVQH